MHPQEQINSYIAEQPEWQRRLLVRLRQLIHATDQEIDETWRWNAPSFDHDGIMLSLHAFKTCVSVWFHKGALLKDTHGLFKLTEKDEERGIRKFKLSEGEAINEKAFVDLVKQAVKLNQAGTKLGDAKPARKALVVPPELESCLRKDGEAWEHWEKFNYTHKKEYVEWIDDAKQDETRKRRIAQALEMIREGVGKEDKHRV
ncbi:MAG TPA: YdeI/OmpD-associated family protein [Flavobacteriales bacterium]|nr:YdeI/OmpD-associated family protein [Flavobacteriales bacterium]HNU56446.1 YdeI/OmpD-associated family protein [Flavobacteriales bacterium]